MKSLANREQNQKNAAYNLGVAEAIRNHKNEKPEFYVRIPIKFLLLTAGPPVRL
jgi:molybdopterin-biosynthesis enzyme MoeA-like protein